MGGMNLAQREYIDMAVAKEIAVTRPETAKSKMGSSGRPVELLTNYFPMQTIKNWDIFQYRVDFVPDIPDTRIRKSLLAREKAKIGGNCFDGTMMFTVKRVGVNEITTKLPTSEETIQIRIKEVGIMSRTDQRFLQIYNIILNRAMAGLKLSQLGRNYYDSKAAVSPTYILEVSKHVFALTIAHKAAQPARVTLWAVVEERRLERRLQNETELPSFITQGKPFPWESPHWKTPNKTIINVASLSSPPPLSHRSRSPLTRSNCGLAT